MEKMFIDILGETTLTKDGATFLRKIDVDHPAAKAIIDASITVDNEVGDGTTSVAVLAGALLKRAKELLEIGIAPTAISDGYSEALMASLGVLDTLLRRTDNSDHQTLLKIAKTCLDSKLSFQAAFSDSAPSIVVDAIEAIADFKRNSVEIDNIKIEEKPGNPFETKLVYGVVIDKTIDSPAMPRTIKNAKVLLIDQELEFRGSRFDSQVIVDSTSKYREAFVTSNNRIRNLVQRIIDSRADIVVSRKGISSFAQSILARSGIISVRRVKENDIHWLERATGAKIMSDVGSALLSSHLGYAGYVHESYVGEDRMIFIEECINPKSVTILLRSSSKVFLDEYHRSIVSGLLVLQNYIQKPGIVYGGGSVELIVADKVRKLAYTTGGKKQIVLGKFADALEEIPLTIARNAGMNELDTMAELRSKISNQTNSKHAWYGINASERRVEDMHHNGVLEPAVVKEQVLKTAVEVSCLLLKVDDVLMMKPVAYTHTHSDGTKHSHSGGDKSHDHHFDRLGKQQRPSHYYF
jgi:chaperonin GroEL (HSP60 family)